MSSIAIMILYCLLIIFSLPFRIILQVLEAAPLPFRNCKVGLQLVDPSSKPTWALSFSNQGETILYYLVIFILWFLVCMDSLVLQVGILNESKLLKVKGKGTIGFSPDTTLCVHLDVSQVPPTPHSDSSHFIACLMESSSQIPGQDSISRPNECQARALTTMPRSGIKISLKCSLINPFSA